MQVLNGLIEGVVASDSGEPVSFSLGFSFIQRLFGNVGHLAFLCFLLFL